MSTAYVAAWDAATRGNAWTFVIARVDSDGRVIISLARQWQGSKTKPLDPEAVIAEIAELCNRYGVSTIMCDGWSTDTLRALARRHGIRLREESSALTDRLARYETIRNLLATHAIELPPVPAVIQDLQGVRKIALSNGIRIELQRTSDGRHCDFAPSIALVASAAPRHARRREAMKGFADELAKAFGEYEEEVAPQVRARSERIERMTASGIPREGRTPRRAPVMTIGLGLNGRVHVSLPSDDNDGGTYGSQKGGGRTSY